MSLSILCLCFRYRETLPVRENDSEEEFLFVEEIDANQ